MNTLDLLDLYRSAGKVRDLVSKELENRLSYIELYELGLTFSAIFKYRKQYPNLTLAEAKKAIENQYNRVKNNG